MAQTVRVREECAEDRDAIHRLLVGAFSGAQEAVLVEALRASGDLPLSLVAELDGQIVGYLGMPRLKSPPRALALAPVAVAPTQQQRGIGARLIEEGIDRARRAGEDIVFVAGDPGYYTRFGFDLDAAQNFSSAYAGSYFMALWLTDQQCQPCQVVYPAAFSDLG